MKKKFLLLAAIGGFSVNVDAANLVDVYKQAIISDPLFLQAMAQRYATKENVPISVANILPQINLTANPTLTRTSLSGSRLQVDPDTGQIISAGNSTTRSYTMTLSATQTIFNFAQFATIAGASATAKSADATLNAALQDLMVRVSAAYFAVLKDEDNVSYSEASKLAYAEQLDQIKQQYNVGLKTITDVYTAQSSYDSASALLIAAQTILSNDRENLRVITGVYYPHISSLDDNFPLLTPKPADIEKWTQISQAQNWSIKAAQHAVDAAREVIHQQFAGHLPTVSAVVAYDKIYSNEFNASNTTVVESGPGIQHDKSVGLNINVPIFSGGAVIANTKQAEYNYQYAQQQLEQAIRKAINIARQSYQSIISGRSQIEADKQAIKSAISSLEGMQESYRVGTQTLVDVLNQQQKVFQAQTQYAADRYAFVNNVLALKQAAGTLSFDDLCAVNSWLTDKAKPAAQRSGLSYPMHPLITQKVDKNNKKMLA